MGEYDYGTRKAITDERKKNLHKRIRKYAKADQSLIKEEYYSYGFDKKQIEPTIRAYQNDSAKNLLNGFCSQGQPRAAGFIRDC